MESYIAATGNSGWLQGLTNQAIGPLQQHCSICAVQCNARSTICVNEIYRLITTHSKQCMTINGGIDVKYIISITVGCNNNCKQ